MDYPKLQEKNDKRRKIPTSEHERIKALYKARQYSQRGLANLYGVSRRLIIFILYPEREKAQKDRVKAEKRWLKYYDKDKQREYMRTHRQNLKENEEHLKEVRKWERTTRKDRNWKNQRSGNCQHCGRYYKYLNDHEKRTKCFENH